MKTQTIAILMLAGVGVFVAIKMGALPGLPGAPSLRDRIFALPGVVPQAEVDRVARSLAPDVSATQAAVSGAITGTTVMPGWGTLAGAGAGLVYGLVK